MSEPTKLETIAASYGIAFDREFGAVAPPIYLSSTFAFAGYEHSGTHEYSRVSNPSRALLAEALARIPLSSRITDALLNHHGPYVSYLDLACHMEDLHAMGELPLICHTHEFRVDDVNRALIRMLCQVRHNLV